MHLIKGADVYSAQGNKLGTLNRVILDPNTRKVTHLVVEKGVLFNSNKIIPIDQVNPQNEEMIILTSSEQDLKGFDDFEEDHFVSLDEAENAEAGVEYSYWYPPPNYAAWRTGMQMVMPPVPTYAIRTTQNIPDGTVALEEGARVESADNKQVGTIEQLIVEPENNHVTHLVISAGLLFKERKLIPVNWISTIGEQEVRLSVNARTLEKLPAYHPAT
jgi:uncharacterized protein YrrD